jgi:tetratricopeptide (TPR) repeat protein
MQSSALHAAQYRLARHYTNQLQKSEDARFSSPVNRSHWIQLIDRDWDQIERWQRWSSADADNEPERLRCCVAFATGAEYTLRRRLAPRAYVKWIEQALKAARLLNDPAAVRLLLFRLAEAQANFTENLDEAEHYAVELADTSRVDNDHLNLGRALWILGSVESTRGSYDRAESRLNESLTYLQMCHASDVETAKASLWLGRIAVYRGNYPLAMKLHLQYFQAMEVVGDEASAGGILPSISGIALFLGDYAAAETYALRAVEIARRLKLRRMLPVSLICLAHAEKTLGRLESACAHYHEAIETGRALMNPSSLINAYYGLAQACFLQGDSNDALIHQQEALALARESRLPFRICEVTSDMVMVRAVRGEIEAARDRLREALTQAAQLGTRRYWTIVTGAAVVLWQQAGEFTQAALWAGAIIDQIDYHEALGLFKQSCQQLEIALGSEDYQRLLTQGKTLTLESVTGEVQERIDQLIL